MGQQQLILLVLATIIVGLAIVVGIRAFNENNVKSNADAMMQDAVRIANDLQAWKQKPAPFGGQASTGVTQAQLEDPADYTNATFALLGYQVGSLGTYQNLNGEFVLNAGASPTIVGQNALLENQITVTVTGLGDAGVAGQIDCLGGTAAAGACPTF